MKCSDQTNEIFAALSKAQADIGPAKLDCYNTFLKSGYSSLGALQDAYKAALAKNGLSIVQLVEDCENGYSLTTMLCHSSGQYISSNSKLILGQKADMQALGAAITYLKRYSISALLGLVDSSDDGVNAQGITAAKQEFKEKSKALVDKKVDEIRQAEERMAVERAKSPGGTISVTRLTEELQKTKKPVKNYAPGTSNIDLPPPEVSHDDITSSMFRPSEYKVEFGKYKGKMLSELGSTVVQATLEWIEKDTKPPRTKSLVNFIDYGKMYLKEVGPS